MQTRLERLVQSIVDLGFTTQDEIDALAKDWSRTLLEDVTTFDDDHETTGFLNFLQTHGVLTSPQLRGLMAILDSAGPPQPAASTDPLVGRRFGEFVTEEKLGEGAMGKIYRARKSDEAGPSNYVVKVFTSAESEDDLERIRREGELLDQIQHPNVVRSFGGGREGEWHYLIMEFVQGETLQELMERRRRLPWEGAIRAVGQIAQALRAIHLLGIVHRDVKPHNVLVKSDGTLKLCDFGLAKAADAVQVRSRAGMILGSPAYIAPEQWGDHDVDARADLFALGVVSYFLVTGAYPFRGRTPADFAIRIRAGDYPPLETLAPGVRPALSWVVTQLLERDRRYRTPTAGALVEDLARVLQQKLPNVPRLEGPGGAFLAMVGKDMFKIGRSPKCDLWLDNPELAEVHVRLERTVSGLLLRTIDEAAWVEVNGQRVQGEVALKPDDEVLLGSGEPWIYRAGNLATNRKARRRGESERYDVLPAPEAEVNVVLPALTVDALVDGGHPLALLACIEDLDQRALGVRIERSVSAAVSAEVGSELVRRMRTRARQIGIRRCEWLSNCLFHTTYENLGAEVDAWLVWWWDARERYPVQVRPERPVQRAYVDIEASDGRRRIGLDRALNEWAVGRSLQSEVSIRDASVSRNHATLLRLGRGYAFRDLGSRQGVRIDGERCTLGTLLPGDVLQLGRVKVQFGLEEEQSAGPNQPAWIDRLCFTVLVEEAAPQVIRALIGLLDPEGLAAKLSPLLEPRAPGVTQDLLVPFLHTQCRQALEALPRACNVDYGDEASRWMEWWHLNASRTPPQLAPQGWLL
ncbi:MAG: protein kinase [Planctomycetes bacterium]|nr:protein kinase [Planctomycetota bacterium]